MMKMDFSMNKRAVILIGAASAAVLVFFISVKPLWTKVGDISAEARALNDDLTQVRDALNDAKSLSSKGRPVSRSEVSLAINEIMEVGAALDIDFFSTSPQQVERNEQSEYPVLPIRMKLQSKYRDFGIFLGKLEQLEKSIVTIKGFEIDRDPLILPDIMVDMTVEIHLKEGEDG